MFEESRDRWSIVPLEFDVFIGMDVDKKSIALTSFEHKQHIDSLKMAHKADIVINYAKKNFRENGLYLLMKQDRLDSDCMTS